MLSSYGQVSMRLESGPFTAPRPNRKQYAALPKSQHELDVERMVDGHQTALPGMRNVVAEAIQERSDRHFFEQTDATADVIELPLPPASGVDVELPLSQAG